MTNEKFEKEMANENFTEETSIKNVLSNETYEIKMNVLAYLRTLMTSTFKDPFSFLDEIFQNGDRSGSKNIWVEFEGYSNDLTIENDGSILEDPQKLLSMSESGWDEGVMKTERPFGIGFFSVFTVSRIVEVISGKRHIIINIDKIFEHNDPTKMEIKILEEEYHGFKLILRNINIDNVSNWQLRGKIQERVQLLGKYIHKLDTYWHNQMIEKKDLTETDGSVFAVTIDEKIAEGELFKGWIALDKNIVSEGVKVFYKGRLVRKLESSDAYYLKGDLHITDKALDLQAPDRKDIIQNTKYDTFLETIKEYAKVLCEDAIVNGKQSDIDEHASVLSFYSDKSKLKAKMKFKVFKGDNDNDLAYLQGMVTTVKKDVKKEISSISDYEVYLREGSEQQPEAHFEEIQSEEVIRVKAPEAKGVVEHPSSSSGGSYSAAYTEKPEIKEDEVEEKDGEVIFVDEQPTFWMAFDEILQFEKKVNIIKHYNLRLIVTRNKFEIEMLKAMTEENVLHIDELKENIKIETTLSNTMLTVKEQRALMLFDMISRMAGFNRNVFAIGDLMVTKTTTIDSLNKSFVSIETEVTAIHNTANKKVYIDRTCVNHSMLRPTLDRMITLQDVQFILANLKDIVAEISLLEFENKEGLYEKILTSLAIADTLKNQEAQIVQTA